MVSRGGFIVLLFSVTILVIMYTFYNNSKNTALTYHLKHTRPDVCSVSFEKSRLKRCEDNKDCEKCGKECIEVTDDAPYTYNREGTTLSVPNGKWCLFPRENEDLKCNPQTGNPVLTRDSSLKKFIWRCECKYPWLVRNAGAYGDCSEVVACNDGDLVCPEGATLCTPGKKWSDEKTWDPAMGVCKCPIEKKYIQMEDRKLCVVDSCFPGHTDTIRNTCQCPQPVKGKDGNWKSNIPIKNSCLPDPCNPHGFYNGSTCVCDPGSIPYQDELSPVGWVCKSPCDKRNNPCGQRGRCYLNSEGEAKCKYCTYPNYQDATNMCANIVRHGNVECTANDQCETGGCSKTFAPLFKIGNGKKYCSPF